MPNRKPYIKIPDGATPEYERTVKKANKKIAELEDKITKMQVFADSQDTLLRDLRRELGEIECVRINQAGMINTHRGKIEAYEFAIKELANAKS